MERRSFLQLIGLAPIVAAAHAAPSAPIDETAAVIPLASEPRPTFDGMRCMTITHLRAPESGDPEDSVWLYERAADGRQVIAARMPDGRIHEMWWTC